MTVTVPETRYARIREQLFDFQTRSQQGDETEEETLSKLRISITISSTGTSPAATCARRTR